jgi:hypothetical protein
VLNTLFRKHDPQIGRFTGVDGLAEKFVSMNPFQFGFNNPVTFNDPTGALTSEATEKADRDNAGGIQFDDGGVYGGYSGGSGGGGGADASTTAANQINNAIDILIGSSPNESIDIHEAFDEVMKPSGQFLIDVRPSESLLLGIILVQD